MSKHSPGPWKVDDRKVLLSAEDEELALLGWGTPTDELLIAAAPEMLALLRSYDAVDTETQARVWWAAKKALLERIDKP